MINRTSGGTRLNIGNWIVPVFESLSRRDLFHHPSERTVVAFSGACFRSIHGPKMSVDIQ